MAHDELADGWTVFRLPRSHWHCQLAGFQWDAVTPTDLRTDIEMFIAKTIAGESPHMLLMGDPGIGKTHVGVAVYRAVAAIVGTGHATWLNVPAFCESAKRSYGDDHADPWEDVELATRLVVFDDLFGRALSQHETTQVVYRLIDSAYRNGAAVLATMNQTLDELWVRLPGHETSRLLADCTVIQMAAGRDWRVE